MTTKRIAVAGVALVAAVVAAFVYAGGLPNFLALLVYLTFQPASALSWDAKNAYVKCEGAIANPAQWPKAPAKACAAMHLCANEAQLSDRLARMLDAAVARTPGCPAL